ncbi:AraC family transcriptional regulator [Synechocystis sp. LEGE 06083]|uniref:AraC family transcriptional regulator n=1 Tax=Synechocystis sp. LEGE 06083 TaxID=915336 RepID=UPI001880F2D5|nr:AraC family transcriptional regulator [Synechocystis sp. LEGE 06083]MBE9196464.1 AraC family transcriptional regulator [Synechocystis sp. LEGE 06083]
MELPPDNREATVHPNQHQLEQSVPFNDEYGVNLALKNYGLLPYHLEKVTNFMQSHLDQDLSVEEIAQELGLSQFHFSRLFKQKTGITPHQYLIKLRLERAKHLLKNTKLAVNEIADECCFANPSHLARHLRRETGLSPKQFRIL